MHSGAIGDLWDIGPGRAFDHVGGLRQFHLDGVEPFAGATVVTRRPAALEATV